LFNIAGSTGTKPNPGCRNAVKITSMKQITLWVAVMLLGTASFAQQPPKKNGIKTVPEKSTQTAPARKKKTANRRPAPLPSPAAVKLSEAGYNDTPPAIDPGPSTAGPSKKEIYEASDGLEQMPVFEGGQGALMRYLSSNLQYPQQAQEADIQGKVVVAFTVCEDGRLCDEKITRGIGGGCDEEALRVIKKMPKWEPGTKDGKPVKVRYMLPVVFQLQD
jgi:protein TonB